MQCVAILFCFLSKDGSSMSFCSTDVTLQTSSATEQNATIQKTKQNPTSKGFWDVKLKHSEVGKCPDYSYLYGLIPFAWGVHTNKTHHIYTVIESTKIPSLSPLTAASFQSPHTPPRMWVWKWPSMPNTLCIFLCTVCHDPQWTTLTNKQILAASPVSYFSVSFVDILRVITVTY